MQKVKSLEALNAIYKDSSEEIKEEECGAIAPGSHLAFLVAPDDAEAAEEGTLRGKRAGGIEDSGEPRADREGACNEEGEKDQVDGPRARAHRVPVRLCPSAKGFPAPRETALARERPVNRRSRRLAAPKSAAVRER